LYEKYKWLSCLDIHNDPWTRKDFANNIEPLRKNPPTRVIPFKNIINKLKISPVDLDYLLMAQKFVYIKDARDDYRRQSVYHALPFFAEIGRRMGIARIDVSYLKQAEIIGFFAGQEKISSSLIGERKRGFIVYLDKKETLVCLQGNEIKIALREFRLLKNEKKELEIVGRIASSGKASGRVVIVRGVKDLGNVNTGDILVAVTTHPDYVPAMRKAAAIITDEGGITSHAAIVSREFSIPCIVGTKHATSILKDGDQIEVNAVEGKITQRL
ncbi:hypothetical protein HY407_03195, partial [Candidatus Gottesmanbacteria bacterium]|nr:hypothetical protein [Candidatus Gottesmanbacteria bacterium]